MQFLADMLDAPVDRPDDYSRRPRSARRFWRDGAPASTRGRKSSHAHGGWSAALRPHGGGRAGVALSRLARRRRALPCALDRGVTDASGLSLRVRRWT